MFDNAFDQDDDVEVQEETALVNELDDYVTSYSSVQLPSTYVVNCCSLSTPSPYIVTDSGAEMTTLGAGWQIMCSEDLPSINIGGPSEHMGKFVCTEALGSLR